MNKLLSCIIEYLKDFIIKDIIETIIYKYALEYEEKYDRTINNNFGNLYHIAVDDDNLYLGTKEKIIVLNKQNNEPVLTADVYGHIRKMYVYDTYLLVGINNDIYLLNKKTLVYIKYIARGESFYFDPCVQSIKLHDDKIYVLNSHYRTLIFNKDTHKLISKYKSNVRKGQTRDKYYKCSDIEIDDNNIYYANTIRSGIEIVKKENKQYVKNFDTKLTENNVTVFDSKINDDIYITKVLFDKEYTYKIFLVHLCGTDTIYVYDDNGKCLRKFGNCEFKDITGIVSYKNEVYLIKESEICVWKIN
jgi:hypothetical protein